MTMTPGLRKLALTAHIISSVGWLGAIAGFLPLAVASLTSQDAQTVRGAYLAMDVIGRTVLMPMALASLLTGLVVSLGSKWGVFRHYWVLVKFLITVVAIIILRKYLQTLSDLAGVAAETTLSGAGRGLRIPTHVGHAVVAMLALLVNATLSVYKPRGMTWYGRRKQDDQPTLAATGGDTGGGPGRGATTGTPRWVKVFGIIAIVLGLLLVIRNLSGVVGGHGPGRHAPSYIPGGHTPPEGGH